MRLHNPTQQKIVLGPSNHWFLRSKLVFEVDTNGYGLNLEVDDVS